MRIGRISRLEWISNSRGVAQIVQSVFFWEKSHRRFVAFFYTNWRAALHALARADTEIVGLSGGVGKTEDRTLRLDGPCEVVERRGSWRAPSCDEKKRGRKEGARNIFGWNESGRLGRFSIAFSLFV
jgi:hypothetical protein